MDAILVVPMNILDQGIKGSVKWDSSLCRWVKTYARLKDGESRSNNKLVIWHAYVWDLDVMSFAVSRMMCGSSFRGFQHEGKQFAWLTDTGYVVIVRFVENERTCRKQSWFRNASNAWHLKQRILISKGQWWWRVYTGNDGGPHERIYLGHLSQDNWSGATNQDLLCLLSR